MPAPTATTTPTGVSGKVSQPSSPSHHLILGRNINTTHNYLYCEYVTGMMTYYDLRVDPHQLRNLLHTLTDSELNFMHQQVRDLRDFSAEKKFWDRKERIDEMRAKEKLRKQKRKKRRENVLKWKKFRKNNSRSKI